MRGCVKLKLTFRRGSGLVSGFTFDVVDFVVPDVGLPFPVLSR